jgi:O-antigen/teichoic acid export membrane protein
MKSPLKDLFNNGVAVAARLASGMVLFVLLGRLMGPSAFGDFMAAMAVASLVAFLANLGLAQQALREVAARPGEALAIADGLASAKVWLATAVVVLSLVLAAWQGGLWWVGAVLTLTLVLDGVVEFLFALMKGRGLYGLEAGLSTSAAVWHLVVVGLVCLVSVQPLHVALAFLGSRALQCLAALWLCGRQMPLPQPRWRVSHGWQQVRAGWAYALDGGLAQLGAQLDTILVRVLMGAQAAGLYQAGMRIVTGMLTLSVVAGNVFIPRLARSLKVPEAAASARRQLRRTYAAMAVLSALGVWGLGLLLTRHGYGAAYSELQSLWPALAGLVAVRVWAANYGVQLTARGLQAFRSLVNLVSLQVMVVLVLCSAAWHWGLLGVVLALVAAATVVMLAYRFKLNKTGSAA